MSRSAYHFHLCSPLCLPVAVGYDTKKATVYAKAEQIISVCYDIFLADDARLCSLEETLGHKYCLFIRSLS